MALKKISLIAISCMLLNACAGGGVNEAKKDVSNQLFKKHTLYGYLTKESNGHYTFSKFSFNKNSHEPWVNLNTLTPAFDTTSYDCATGGLVGSASGKNNQMCDNEKLRERLFQSSKVSVGDMAQSTIGNAAYIVFSFGLGALSAEGHYTSRFDEDTYEKAVKEATSKISLTQLSNQINTFLAFKNSAETKLKNIFEQRHSELTKALSVKFFDKSGLYAQSFDKSNVTVVDKHMNYGLELSRKSFTDIKQLYDWLDADVKNKKNSVRYYIKCGLKGLSGWKISTQGCQLNYNIDEMVKTVPVSYTVMSKDYYKVDYFPSLEDKNVQILASGNDIKIINKTKSFVSAKILSIYVGKTIEKIDNLNIEVSPLGETTIAHKRNFPHSQQDLILKNVTKKDINKKIAIGAALKYVVVDTNKEQTLFKLNDVKPVKYHK